MRLPGSAAAPAARCFAQLPEVGSLPDKLLSKDEQQGKVADMIAQGQSHQTEAAKQIEKGK